VKKRGKRERQPRKSQKGKKGNHQKQTPFFSGKKEREGEGGAVLLKGQKGGMDCNFRAEKKIAGATSYSRKKERGGEKFHFEGHSTILKKGKRPREQKEKGKRGRCLL